MPAANATPPTIGLNTIVCGVDMSIVKNPMSTLFQWLVSLVAAAPVFIVGPQLA